jgi:ABC-type phosphate transport system substrate-binding protein
MVSRSRSARIIAMLFLVAVTVSPAAASAQDEEIIVGGSPLLSALSQRAAAELSQVTVVEDGSTEAGLGALCAGEAHVANAARPISADEAALCAENGVEWVELRLGDAVLAFVAAPDTALPACLTADDLGRALAAGVDNWQQVNPTLPDAPVDRAAAPAVYADFVQLAAQEVGLATGQVAEFAAAEDEAAFDPHTIGLATLAGVGDLNVLALDAGAGCVSPTEDEAIERGYPLVFPLYAYVRADAATNETVTGYIAALLDGVAAEDSVLPPSDDDTALGLANLGAAVTGRAFSMPAYTPPDSLSGTVTVSSGRALYPFVFGIGETFHAGSPGVEISLDLADDAAAIASVCAGDADTAVLLRAPTEDDLAGCADMITAEIGYAAVALATNIANDAVTCLSIDELRAIWQPESEGAVTNWSQVRADLPTLDLFTCGLEADGHLFDFFTENVTGAAGAIRLDYAAAPANEAYNCTAEPGGLAFLDYGTYAAHRDAVRLLAVEGGAGCVMPGPVSAQAGSYALAHPVVLAVRADALAREPVLAFTLSVLAAGDDALEAAGLMPPLPAARRQHIERVLAAVP